MEPPGTEHAARLMEWQAQVCRRLGSPFYADLLPLVAADLRGGGPTAEVLAGYLSAPSSSALPLRMLGAAHALALTGQAPELAACYPSAGGGAGAAGAAAWPALRQALAAHRPFIQGWLARPPQTNEVGRGAVLLGGLRHIAAEASLPVRLVEVGASAGLNLRADHFHVAGDSGRYGEPSSPVVLPGAWRGAPPPQARIEVIARSGGDLDPIDPGSAAGRLQLTAYTWPDQAARLARLRGALALAQSVPVELRQESATQTIARTRLAAGTWTVLWHSVFHDYLSVAQRAELAAGAAALGGAATAAARFAYLHLEPAQPGRPFAVTLTTWPGGCERVLGTASPHGLPVTWHARPEPEDPGRAGGRAGPGGAGTGGAGTGGAGTGGADVTEAG